MNEIHLDDVRAALSLAEFNPAVMLSMAPTDRRPPPLSPPPRQAGVLALLTGEPDDLHVVLTRRTDKLNGHSGQMSFPGGRRDDGDADFWETALRETTEELGIPNDDIEYLGSLHNLYIPPSNFDVYPFVGYLRTLPPLNPSRDEVAAVYLAPVSALLDPQTRTVAQIEIKGGLHDVPAYVLCDQIVWGATAIMLCELESRLRLILKSHNIQ